MLICFSTLSFCVQNQHKIIPVDMKRNYVCFLDYTLLSIQLLLQGVKSLKKGQTFTDPDITKFRSICSLNREKILKG